MEFEDFDDDLLNDLEDMPASSSSAATAQQHHQPGKPKVADSSQQQAPTWSFAGNSSGAKAKGGGEAAIRPFSPGGIDDAPSGPQRMIEAPKPAQKLTGAAALLAQLEQKSGGGVAGGSRGGGGGGGGGARGSASSSQQTRGNGLGEGMQYQSGGTHPPVLGDLKASFALRRFLQTSLGGPKVRLADGFNKWYILLFQLMLWILPVVIGVPCSLVHCAYETSCPTATVLSRYTAPLIAGALLLFVHAILFVASRVLYKSGRGAVKELGAGAARMFEEEDDTDFSGACTPEALSYVLPWRGWLALPLGLVPASMLALSVHYLSPQVAAAAVGDAGSGAYAAFGWNVVCLAAYSATAQAPPEPNSYRSEAHPEGAAVVSRALHVCIIIALAAATVDAAPLRVLLLVLPLLWAFGTLPQADVLIEYLAEQTLVHLHGGSYAASTTRLAFMLFLAWSVAGLGAIVDAYVGSSSALAVMGALSFIISGDIYPSFSYFSSSSQSSSSSSSSLRTEQILSRLAIRSLGQVIVAVTAMVLLIVLPLISWPKVCQSPVWAIAITTPCATSLLSSWFQRPYLGGLVVNPVFYVASRGSRASLVSSRLLFILSLLHKSSNYIGSLIISAHIAATALDKTCYPTYSTQGISVGERIIRCVLAARVLRRAWQSPVGALIEGTVASWIVYIAGQAWMMPLVGVYGSPIVWMLAGVCVGRLGELWNKAAFASILALTSWTDAKQRAKHAGKVLALNALLFPIVAAVIVASAVISSPLLPLLGLPLFVVGFPRPRRHWPNLGSGPESTALEAAYYQQASPALLKSLIAAAASGSLGAGIAGGEFFLLRRDTLLVLVQVLEAGRGYAVVSIKGMELQETSCHHVEAGAVEEVMDGAVGDCSSSGAGPPIRLINPYYAHTLEGLCHLSAEAYSVGDTQLTGIIDRPENKTVLPGYFACALVWLLRRRLRGLDGGLPTSWLDTRKVDDTGVNLSSSKSATVFPADWAAKIDVWGPWEGEIGDVAKEEMRIKGSQIAPAPKEDKGKGKGKGKGNGEKDGDLGAEVAKEVNGNKGLNGGVGTVGDAKGRGDGAALKESSLEDLLDNLDDADSLIPGGGFEAESQSVRRGASLHSPSSKQKVDPGGVVSFEDEGNGDGDDQVFSFSPKDVAKVDAPATKSPFSYGTAGGNAPSLSLEDGDKVGGTFSFEPRGGAGGGGVGDDFDELMDDLEGLGLDDDDDSGRGVAVSGARFGVDDADDLLDELEELGGGAEAHSNQFKSEADPVGLRSEATLGEGRTSEPSTLDVQKPPRGKGPIDPEMQRQCQRLVSACYACVEEWGATTSASGADHIAKMWEGHVPSSLTESEWLGKNQGLKEVVCRAYRYAFKLSYDQIVYGTGDTPSDMEESFKEYDEGWYMGAESSREWAGAVKEEIPNLLAVWGDKGVYRARALTLVKGTFQAARMNDESVRGIWSSLGMELYYFTNDDEERYSIQANTSVLRNLMVQSSAPPLGYALYSNVETAYHYF